MKVYLIMKKTRGGGLWDPKYLVSMHLESENAWAAYHERQQRAANAEELVLYQLWVMDPVVSPVERRQLA